ncbi:ATP-binding protein [Streptomyces sp. NPDC093093]|uniref:ATP-binding protein n=1 Tax=Streptomyces sp. NPDC093093 TaxID=3366025 RepID=UPI0038171940
MRYDVNGPAQPVPHTAMEARDRVRFLLGSAGLVGVGPDGEDVLTDALLVTSELATNAIRHGGGITGFSASVSENGLRLSITDPSGDRPVTLPRQAGTFLAGGFGWPLIQRLSHSMTVTVLPAGGKRITVLVPLAAPAVAPDRTGPLDSERDSALDRDLDHALGSDHTFGSDHTLGPALDRDLDRVSRRSDAAS